MCDTLPLNYHIDNQISVSTSEEVFVVKTFGEYTFLYEPCTCLGSHISPEAGIYGPPGGRQAWKPYSQHTVQL